MSDFVGVLALLSALALGGAVMPHLAGWRASRAAHALEPEDKSSKARIRMLADAMHGLPGDNFLLLRLLAASVVIYAHSYAVSGIPGATDLITRSGIGIYSGSIAVYVFFVISGFLVTGSWLRRKHLGEFLASRAFRIVPGYAACLAGSALLLGAAVTTLEPEAYFADPATWRYITHNLTFPIDMQWTLPGVFETHAHTAVNGSLWTLPAEVRVYAWLAIFAVLGLLAHAPRALLGVLLLALLAQQTGSVPLLAVAEFLPMASCFALGGFAYLVQRQLPLNAWILAALVIVALLLRSTGVYLHAFVLALAYGVLWFAYVPRQLLWFNRIGDYSYGLYLWGFPMQQLAVYALETPTPTQISLFAWPSALLLAMASWHAIERPVLRLRRNARSTTATDPASSVPHG